MSRSTLHTSNVNRGGIAVTTSHRTLWQIVFLDDNGQLISIKVPFFAEGSPKRWLEDRGVSLEDALVERIR